MRLYKVFSATHPDWAGELIESSPYSNGDQSDALRAINNDAHRYVVTIQTCEPDGYTLSPTRPSPRPGASGSRSTSSNSTPSAAT